jgi:DNA ligase-1
VQAVFDRALAAGAEGLMLKRLGGPYEPDKRAPGWAKLKKDYIEQAEDGATAGGGGATLDLVPIGAWRGSGRKHQWYSPFLLAAYDPETETWASVCRVMSGFSDAFYKQKTAFYRDEGDDDVAAGRLLACKPPYYVTGDTPDVWFAPTEVWEIRGADLTVSPRHAAAAGRVHATRGISLRFPRFMRLRPDRTPETASGPDDVAELFLAQHRCGDAAAAAEDLDDERGDDDEPPPHAAAEAR